MIVCYSEQNLENNKNEQTNTKNQSNDQEGLRTNQNKIRNDDWSITQWV